MAETFLYLTTKGRTSGQPRQIEIWFVENDGRYYLVSELREKSNWLQNIQADSNISFSVGTRDDQQSEVARSNGQGRVVDMQAEPDLVRTVKALMDRKYEWSNGLIVELCSSDG